MGPTKPKQPKQSFQPIISINNQIFNFNQQNQTQEKIHSQEIQGQESEDESYD